MVRRPVAMSEAREEASPSFSRYSPILDSRKVEYQAITPTTMSVPMRVTIAVTGLMSQSCTAPRVAIIMALTNSGNEK